MTPEQIEILRNAPAKSRDRIIARIAGRSRAALELILERPAEAKAIAQFALEDANQELERLKSLDI